MKPIIINNFQYGVGASAYVGFQEFRGLNIVDEPGVCFPNKALTKESDTVVDGLIHTMKRDPLTGIVYGVSNTKFFKRTTGGTWSVITGHGSTASYAFKGLEIWRSFNGNGSYIFLFHEGGSIDVYDSSTGQSWTDNLKNAGATTGGSLDFKRPSCVAQDRIYVLSGAGNYGLSEIKENDGETFDPDTSTTYTVTATKLDYPKNNKGMSIEEISGRLLIGTTISQDDTKATIFPWDYINDTTAYDRPIELGVDTVWQMAKKKNTVYVHAGLNGEIFATNGSLTADEFAKIPHTLCPTQFDNPSAIVLYPDAFKVWGNKLLIGWGSDSAGASGYNLGVYSINLKTGGAAIENLISLGEDGTNSGIEIGSILPLDTKTYLVSWFDYNSSTYGVDKLSTTAITSDKAYFITEFIPIGTKTNPVTLQAPEIKLVKALTSGDSVKVWYRQEQDASWTLHHTMDTVGLKSEKMKAIPRLENIQLKVALNQNAKLIQLILQ